MDGVPPGNYGASSGDVKNRTELDLAKRVPRGLGKWSTGESTPPYSGLLAAGILVTSKADLENKAADEVMNLTLPKRIKLILAVAAVFADHDYRTVPLA